MSLQESQPQEPQNPSPGAPDPLMAATQAARSLQGLSTELTARVPQLLEAMRSVGTGLELHSTLDRICETAAELADSRYAAIGVVDTEGRGLSDFVTYGISSELARKIGHRPDGKRGLLGALISHPDTVHLDDLTKDPRSAGFPPHHPPMKTFLGVPIRVQGRFSAICTSPRRTAVTRSTTTTCTWSGCWPPRRASPLAMPGCTRPPLSASAGSTAR